MPSASEEQCHFVRSCYAILVLYSDLQTTVALRSTSGMLLLQPCHMSVMQQPNAILRWTVSARVILIITTLLTQETSYHMKFGHMSG